MKIGFNVKIIKDTLKMFEQSINYLYNKIIELENKTSSEWIEITSANGQEAIISQPFSEIRLQATSIMGYNYSVTYNYDSAIFHNTQGNGSTYMICGNPTANNYGCKFKYMVASDNNQYVSVDSCFSGSTYDAYEFRAWIKPV